MLVWKLSRPRILTPAHVATPFTLEHSACNASILGIDDAVPLKFVRCIQNALCKKYKSEFNDDMCVVSCIVHHIL
jgi:hypothetical protein